MKLKHHAFRFGLIGNLKVLLCRIFGHRVSDDPAGFTCQRCRLAYEEIYYPEDYWKEMIQFMKPKPENVVTKELVAELVDELMKHTWFPSTEHQVDLFERCAPYLDIPEMPESLNHPPIFPRRGAVEDSSPILDGSEMIGEETVDEYLDRLVKEASPSWQGVDPQQFMDEVRGCNAGLGWKKGAPDTSWNYLIVTTICRSPYPEQYDPGDKEWELTKILWHIGPIPPVPHNDAE